MNHHRARVELLAESVISTAEPNLIKLCSVTGRFLHHIRTHVSLQIFELPEVVNLGVARWI